MADTSFEAEFTYKIENVVATVVVSLTNRMDLNVIAQKYDDVEYNPERFPGLIMRMDKPKATILVFSTGKMVITGLRQAEDAPKVVDTVMKRIQKCKIPIANPEIIIQNIVASGDLKCAIDLNMAAVVMEYSMYEPEVFPGLIYRMQEPYAVFLIFSTGKIVCTGTKNEEMVKASIKKLYAQVREYGVARDPNADESSEGGDEDEEDQMFL
jgi:transcription initiation factor TFIID TATA-box-binding protein